MNFNEDHKFSREFKKLCKKYKKLSSDFEVFKKTHGQLYIDEKSEYRKRFFSSRHITVLHRGKNQTSLVVKARLYSSDLRRSALRVIYCVQVQEITLIEIYAKNQKDNEDKKRWQTYAVG